MAGGKQPILKKNDPKKESNSNKEKRVISNAKLPKKDPFERVLEILEDYDRGTQPYQDKVDHWGE